MPAITAHELDLAFGGAPVLDCASFALERGERVALLGRNGAGKSSLLKLLAGEARPDSGELRFEAGAPGVLVAQEPQLPTGQTVAAVLEEALARAHGGARRATEILTPLGLDGDTPIGRLSGGGQRRLALACALASAPEVLLLDEPTNHLDVAAIEWLEDYLRRYAGALLFVTHDRRFLTRLATRILELDRGALRSYAGDYADFLRRRDERLQTEARHAALFDKTLAQEEAWIRRGIEARRTRNEGRVRALYVLREQRAQRRTLQGNARMALDAGEMSGRVVIEAQQVAFSYGDKPVVREYNARILRGDRIGLVGPNGAGKTTLLRLLLKQLDPQAGEVSHGTKLAIGYFDQLRAQLDPDARVVDCVGEGKDTVTIDGQQRHVMGYLQDFLFTAQRARSPVKSLSGGERARLLLARLFSRPANLLVMDEPTNDLDLETLELLESLLSDYSGTLLMVSHDRAFLDNVVTSILAFEGDGTVKEYVGGYSDYERQREIPAPSVAPDATNTDANIKTAATTRARTPNARLSFNEQRELAQLPGRIEALEQEQASLQAEMARPEAYGDAAAAKARSARLKVLQEELAQAYARWEALEQRRPSGG